MGTLFCRLRDLLDRPDWRERYADWYRSVESRARRSLVKRLRLSRPEAWHTERLQTTLQECKLRYAGAGVCRYIERRLYGLLSALVAELLAEAGLTAERARGLDERLDLPGNVTRLLACDVLLIRNGRNILRLGESARAALVDRDRMERRNDSL